MSYFLFSLSPKKKIREFFFIFYSFHFDGIFSQKTGKKYLNFNAKNSPKKLLL